MTKKLTSIEIGYGDSSNSWDLTDGDSFVDTPQEFILKDQDGYSRARYFRQWVTYIEYNYDED